MSVEIVKTYVKAREDKDIEGVLATVVDDVVFTDASNNVYTGKEEFRKYLKDNPPLPSQWSEPEPGSNHGDVLVKGKVKKFFMWWDVEVTFVVEDLIKKITIVRK